MRLTSVLRASAPLDEARLRLRSRFLARWPAASTPSSHPTNRAKPALTAVSVSAVSDATVHLEAARQRLRARYLAQWPAADAPTSLPTNGANQALTAVSVSGVNDATDHLEAARQRLRARYLARWPKGHVTECRLPQPSVTDVSAATVVITAANNEKATFMQNERLSENSAKPIAETTVEITQRFPQPLWSDMRIPNMLRQDALSDQRALASSSLRDV